MKKKLTVAEYISKMIELSPKTQKEIAQEAGFDKPNFITMLKQGTNKLPLDRVPGFARAIGVDPKHLMNLCLQEYQPTLYETYKDVMGLPLTDAEEDLIRTIREQLGQTPRIDTGLRDDIVRVLERAVS